MAPARTAVALGSPRSQSLPLRIDARRLGVSVFAICALGLASSSASASGQFASPLATTSPDPQVTASFAGYSSPENSPPDTTLAASPNEVMELTNEGYLLTNRTGQGTRGTLAQLVGRSGVYLSDPQVLWDPSTGRFYFSVYENRGTSKPNEGLAWGFSKTATPTTSSDFCTYWARFNYGETSFPDRETLGDTSDFLLIASDRFSTANESWLGSDLAWVTKPPAGSTCPATSALKRGIVALKNPDGTAPWAPVPVRQVDSSDSGWILATPTDGPHMANLTLWRIAKTSTGRAKVEAPASVPVPEYSPPAFAPQAGQTISGETAPLLETEVFLTQVIAAYDPRVGHTVLWTANAVAGGAGAQVRWYEVDPAAHAIDQLGTVSDPKLYVFNPTIAPDRVVDGASVAFGADAVMDVNTSSSTTDPAIQMTATTDGQTQSPLMMVEQSPGPNVDFSCYEPVRHGICRWGDYSGAAPDPGASTTAPIGDVWLANQWNVADINDSTPVWRTSVWQASP